MPVRSWPAWSCSPVLSNSLCSKCTILKCVFARNTKMQKTTLRTLQVYLTVEDNVLISARREDWFQWAHLIPSSLLITQSLTCPAVVSLFNDARKMLSSAGLLKAGSLVSFEVFQGWQMHSVGLGDLCPSGRSSEEQAGYPVLYIPHLPAVAWPGTNSVGFPQYTEISGFATCVIHAKCSNKVILH